MNKEIFVLIGIAASGKSTYSMALMDQYSGFVTKVLNADTIRKKLYGDATIQGNGDEVFGILFKEYTDCLRDQNTKLIIIDNTSLTPKMRKRYWKLADTICPMFGNTVDYNLVYFQPDLKRSLLWNSKRDRHVPDDVIRAQFERCTPPSEAEKEYSNVIIIE